MSSYKMSYFFGSYICSKNKIKIESDLSNYGTKSDIKNTTSVDSKLLPKKANLAHLNQMLMNLILISSKLFPLI